jgi:hypothetical protein
MNVVVPFYQKYGSISNAYDVKVQQNLKYYDSF